MNLSPRWTVLLVDAVHWSTVGALVTIDVNRTRLRVLPLRRKGKA